jgi:hypothetical protein
MQKHSNEKKILDLRVVSSELSLETWALFLGFVFTMGNAGAKDTLEYRRNYPGKVDNPKIDCNLRFYKNELKSSPDGDFIDSIHGKWRGNFKLLEQHHGYIQWIFPIREESAFNGDALPLQLHEARAIQEDPACRERVVLSYQMMLEFYGFSLLNRETGEIARSANFEARFANLSRSSHNWLRVSRILKSLGELGFERFKLPWLLAITREVFEEQRLLGPCKTSLLSFWSLTLRSKEDQEVLKRAIAAFIPDAETFVIQE